MTDFDRDALLGEIEQGAGQTLPARVWTVARFDGKGFSNLTRKYERPFDPIIGDAMKAACLSIASVMQPKFIYTTSDEISVFWKTDLAKGQQLPFGNRQQKIVSIGAAAATAGFMSSHVPTALPIFDGRAFCLYDDSLAFQYLKSRLASGKRNSVSGLAQEHYSHKEMFGKSIAEQFKMLEDNGVSWEQMPGQYRHGVLSYKENVEMSSAEGHTYVRSCWQQIVAKDIDPTTIGINLPSPDDTPPGYSDDGMPQLTAKQLVEVNAIIRPLCGVYATVAEQYEAGWVYSIHVGSMTPDEAVAALAELDVFLDSRRDISDVAHFDVVFGEG